MRAKLSLWGSNTGRQEEDKMQMGRKNNQTVKLMKGRAASPLGLCYCDEMPLTLAEYFLERKEKQKGGRL